MGDRIFVVDPATKKPTAVDPVAFSALNIRERSDLQEWVIDHIELLGEKLLFVTSEFHGFDRSDRRIDILALDEAGTLVVVELKLDAAGTLADQQAIRYAAFCSRMSMDDVVGLLAASAGCPTEEADERVREFLGTDELPELGNRPRIILAAGSMEDQELTTCVLWLRTFGVRHHLCGTDALQDPRVGQHHPRPENDRAAP